MKHCKAFVKGITCLDLYLIGRCSHLGCHECDAISEDPIRQYINNHIECKFCMNRSDDFCVLHNLQGDEGIMCSNMDLEV